MKPAPFDPTVSYLDPSSKLIVRSKRSNLSDGYSTSGSSAIFDESGKKLLWTAPAFACRHKIDLSPDGAFLALSGNQYFENFLRVRSDEVILSVFGREGGLKRVTLADLFSEDPRVIATREEWQTMGGGWLEASRLVSNLTIDWGRGGATFVLYDGTTKVIPFEIA